MADVGFLPAAMHVVKKELRQRDTRALYTLIQSYKRQQSHVSVVSRLHVRISAPCGLRTRISNVNQLTVYWKHKRFRCTIDQHIQKAATKS
jgi:hypothetical protein